MNDGVSFVVKIMQALSSFVGGNFCQTVKKEHQEGQIIKAEVVKNVTNDSILRLTVQIENGEIKTFDFNLMTVDIPSFQNKAVSMSYYATANKPAVVAVITFK